MASWDHLDAATRLQEKYPDRDTDAQVDRIHRAADIYARLAAAPTEVAMLAGSVMEQRLAQRRARRFDFEDVLNKLNDEAGEAS